MFLIFPLAVPKLIASGKRIKVPLEISTVYVYLAWADRQVFLFDKNCKLN